MSGWSKVHCLLSFDSHPQHSDDGDNEDERLLPSCEKSICLLLSSPSLQVFFSAYIFNSNVMVKVATQPAENPIDVLSRKLHLGPGMGRDVPRLSLPGKLVFPR